MSVLIDTSGLYCFLDAADRRHSQAVRHLTSAQSAITHSYVLAELVALAQVRGLDREIVLRFIEALIDGAEIEVIWPQERETRLALDLLGNRSDKRYSLCDAVSFVLMRQRQIVQALTTDHHFEQEGFQKLLES